MKNTLKFSLDSFRQLDLADILINIWDYADHLKQKECIVCRTYQNWCITAAKEKWSYLYVDFDFAIDNLQKQNKNWIDIDAFSSERKNQIYFHILKIQNRI